MLKWRTALGDHSHIGMKRRRFLGASAAVLSLPGYVSSGVQDILFAKYARETLPLTSASTLVVEPRTFGLSDEPLPWRSPSELRSAMPGMFESTATALLESTARSDDVLLPTSELPSGLNVVYPTAAVLKTIFAGDSHTESWSRFYKAFPGSSGLLSFSSAAFDSAGSQAAFIFRFECGGKCGGAHLVLMARSGATWRTDAQALLWVS